MSDGYIESGTELLMFVKETGIADHDQDAVKALDGIMKDLVKEFTEQRITPARRIKRAYGTGFIHGLKFAADLSRMELRRKRFEEGMDPETGKPAKKEGAAN